MAGIQVIITSAFCKDGAGGNTAGIVLDHPELNNVQKMRISKELGFSETAFVTSSIQADYKLEYFTPTDEVPLCGHATIATFAALHHAGLITGKTCSIETKAGILQVSVSDDGLVMMQQNTPQYGEWVERDALLPCLGEAISRKVQSRIVSTGLRDIIVPCTTVRELHAMLPDFDAIAKLSREKNVIGIHAFAFPSDNQEVDAICRNFAPLYGIDEESATGTSSCALAGYLFSNGYKKDNYIFEQGCVLDLPSRIIVKIVQQEDRIEKIYVGGYGRVLKKTTVVC